MSFLSRGDDVDWIFCTYCLHSPVPAVQFCLVCEASLCDGHLTAHSTSEEHVFLDQEKVLETRPTGDAVEESQILGHKLRNALQKLISDRETMERRVRSLRERRRKIQETAKGRAEKALRLFGDIRRHLEDLERRVYSEITRREEKASLSASEQIQRLELQKDELSRKIRHIEALCGHTNAPPMVLQDPVGVTGADLDFDDDDLDEDLIVDTLHQGLSDIAMSLRRSCQSWERSDILLDVGTATNNAYITRCLTQVSSTSLGGNRPETPDRFRFNQVLSCCSFSSGRHSWDVETNVTGEWRVGASYYSLDREGDQAHVGRNSRSWCLWGYYNNYYVSHGGRHTYLPIRLSSYIFRIFLDYEAGQLSFYEVGDTMRHLHTFTATFTEPLHAAFYVSGGSWIVIRH